MRVAAAYVVVAWLLIQVTETIFPLFGFDDTPARIVVIVLAIGFMPAMIFAWAFELTPEGLKKESEVDRTQSITPNTGKKLDRMIMVVLALALGYFAFDKFVLDPQRESTMEEQKTTEVAQARQEGRLLVAGVHAAQDDGSALGIEQGLAFDAQLSAELRGCARGLGVGQGGREEQETREQAASVHARSLGSVRE